MSVGVPGHRGDPVTQTDTFIFQRLGHLKCARPDLRQCRASDRAFNGPRNLLAFTVIKRRVVNYSVRQ